jgi:sugar transferase (PEP-CTERM/EpsH1 system associated)
MNILYVTPYVPSQIRTRPYNLLRTLRQHGHGVTLLTASGMSQGEQAQAGELEDWGIRVELFPVSIGRSLGNAVRELASGVSFQAVYARHPAMGRRLVELVHSGAFDVVHVEHLRASWLIPLVEDLPVVYDSVDCISLLFEHTLRSGPRWTSRLKARLDLARTRRYESLLLRSVSRVVVTSERDRSALEGLARGDNHAPITVIPNGVDLAYFRPPADAESGDGHTVVFTGKMSYHANEAAVLFFAEQVLPRIWAEKPEVRFRVVGKDPTGAIRALQTDGRVEVTGTVDDMRPYLAQAAVSVCPAKYAVGVQNKVLEAMAMGTPVVTSSTGAAGFAAEDGRHFLVADDPADFAAAVLSVLASKELARRLSGEGRRFVEQHHNWESSAAALVGVYEQAVAAV